MYALWNGRRSRYVLEDDVSLSLVLAVVGIMVMVIPTRPTLLIGGAFCAAGAVVALWSRGEL